VIALILIALWSPGRDDQRGGNDTSEFRAAENAVPPGNFELSPPVSALGQNSPGPPGASAVTPATKNGAAQPVSGGPAAPVTDAPTEVVKSASAEYRPLSGAVARIRPNQPTASSMTAGVRGERPGSSGGSASAGSFGGFGAGSTNSPGAASGDAEPTTNQLRPMIIDPATGGLKPDDPGGDPAGNGSNGNSNGNGSIGPFQSIQDDLDGGQATGPLGDNNGLGGNGPGSSVSHPELPDLSTGLPSGNETGGPANNGSGAGNPGTPTKQAADRVATVPEPAPLLLLGSALFFARLHFRRVMGRRPER
jgi:hypothetical protein